jgi:hypothetical protein
MNIISVFRNKVVLLLFFVATLAVNVFSQDKGYQAFEGTRISMKVPEGFEKVQGQEVFFHQGSGTTIQVKEVPNIASVYTMQAFTKEALEENEGVVFISSEDIQVASGLDGKLITVGFNVEGMDYERMMLITGDYNYSVIINANYPKMTKKLMFDVLKKSLISIKF